MRYLIALIVVSCLVDAASACQTRRTPVRNVLSALRPANIVRVERTRIVERVRVLPWFGAVRFATPCGPLGCPVPPAKK